MYFELPLVTNQINSSMKLAINPEIAAKINPYLISITYISKVSQSSPVVMIFEKIVPSRNPTQMPESIVIEGEGLPDIDKTQCTNY